MRHYQVYLTSRQFSNKPYNDILALLILSPFVERWHASLVGQGLNRGMSFRISYFKGEPNHAAAIYHVFRKFIFGNIWYLTLY